MAAEGLLKLASQLADGERVIVTASLPNCSFEVITRQVRAIFKHNAGD